MQAYLTSAQVAKELQVSRQTAICIIQCYIPHLRVANNQYRVKREDFDAYVAAHTVAPHNTKRGF